MIRHIRLAPLVLALLAAPAAAQSSLGLNFLEVTASASGGGQTVLRFTGDYRVTGAHGLQMDLSGSTPGSDLLAQVDAHLYMQPRAEAKYGLFLSVADLNDRSGTIGVAGVEGMFALGEATVASGRISAGLAQPQGLDFVALDVGMTHAVGMQGALYGSVSLAAVDEASLRTTAWSAEFGYVHSIAATGFEVSAGLGATGLSGAADGGADVSARIGVTWRFGGDRGPRRGLADRSFGAIRPLEPLLMRGIF
jgi:hypothetical protein